MPVLATNVQEHKGLYFWRAAEADPDRDSALATGEASTSKGHGGREGACLGAPIFSKDKVCTGIRV